MENEISRNSLHSSILRVAQYAVAISFLATIGSFFTNILIFSSWGLDFTIVATPSDIVVGGLLAFSAMFPIAALAIPAYLLASRFMGRGELSGTPARYITLIIFLFFMYLSVQQAAADRVFFGYTIYVFEKWSLYFYISVFVLTLFCFIVYINRYIEKYTSFIISVIFLIWLTNLIYSAGEREFDIWIISKSDRCKEREYVVWVGSSSLVTTCSPPPHRRGKEYSIVERNGVEMRAIRRELGLGFS